MRCDWCMKAITEQFATVRDKHVCSAECLMWYSAYLMGDAAKKTAKEIVKVIEEMERKEEIYLDLDDDLPF